MMCYKDMTFCPFHKTCANADGCPRALTDEVQKEAQEWWGNEGEAPIAVFGSPPACYRFRCLEDSPCPHGCIFDGGRLQGDCRIPWSDDCELNRRDRLKNYSVALP